MDDRYARLIFVVGLLLGSNGCTEKEKAPEMKPHAMLRQPGNKKPTLRLMTFNIAHGRQGGFHQALLDRPTIERNLDLIARFVDESNVDILALQEADGESAWSGRFDHVGRIADVAGLRSAFRGSHTSTDRGVSLDFGTALLTRFPATKASSERFKASWRDNKGFVIADVQVKMGGDTKSLRVASVHLDFLSPWVRKRQVSLLISEIHAREEKAGAAPLVIMGDFNCTLREKACLPQLEKRLQLKIHDRNSGDWTKSVFGIKRRIDWILVSRDIEVLQAASPEVSLSDHRPVLADIAWR